MPNFVICLLAAFGLRTSISALFYLFVFCNTKQNKTERNFETSFLPLSSLSRHTSSTLIPIIISMLLLPFLRPLVIHFLFFILPTCPAELYFTFSSFCVLLVCAFLLL